MLFHLIIFFLLPLELLGLGSLVFLGGKISGGRSGSQSGNRLGRFPWELLVLFLHCLTGSNLVMLFLSVLVLVFCLTFVFLLFILRLFVFTIVIFFVFRFIVIATDLFNEWS